jgi:Flp pilus assembly pilin Flp
MEKLMNFFKEEEGATAVEYGIMVAAIAATMMPYSTAVAPSSSLKKLMSFSMGPISLIWFNICLHQYNDAGGAVLYSFFWVNIYNKTSCQGKCFCLVCFKYFYLVCWFIIIIQGYIQKHLVKALS